MRKEQNLHTLFKEIVHREQTYVGILSQLSIDKIY